MHHQIYTLTPCLWGSNSQCTPIVKWHSYLQCPVSPSLFFFDSVVQSSTMRRTRWVDSLWSYFIVDCRFGISGAFRYLLCFFACFSISLSFSHFLSLNHKNLYHWKIMNLWKSLCTDAFDNVACVVCPCMAYHCWLLERQNYGCYKSTIYIQLSNTVQQHFSLPPIISVSFYTFPKQHTSHVQNDKCRFQSVTKFVFGLGYKQKKLCQ